MPQPTSSSAPRTLRLSIGAAVVLGLVVLSAAVGLGIMRGQAAPTESVPVADASAAPSGDLYVHVLDQLSVTVAWSSQHH